MTIKEAAEKFSLSESDVRKRKRDGMILGVKTVDGRVVIPEDTLIIPSKMEIKNFLFQILKYKNNRGLTISRSLCPDENSLKAVVYYLYKKGFIGEFRFDRDISVLFKEFH